MKDQDAILATAAASPPRRWFALIVVSGLGWLLLYLALSAQAAPGWTGFLIALGVGALWLALRLWQATARALVLTDEGLFDSDGTVLARIEDIASVDRGIFAMKPSNGFILRLRRPGPRAWHPGLWWRLGRRVAVGGVTAASQTRPMADILTIRLQDRR